MLSKLFRFETLRVSSRLLPRSEVTLGFGKNLDQLLKDFAGRKDLLVLGVPRGGVPVAYEVATALRVPMDIFVLRKLGVPGQ